MFTDRFTFNTDVTMDGNGTNYTILHGTKTQQIKNFNKTNNFVYKKTISIQFYKTFGIIKKQIGFGDIIEFITKYTGIKYLIIKITKGNCGCERRRKKFNNILQIPYYVLYFEDSFVDDLNLNKFKNIFKNIFKKKNIVTSKDAVWVENLKKEKIKKAEGPKKPCGCGATKQIITQTQQK